MKYAERLIRIFYFLFLQRGYTLHSLLPNIIHLQSPFLKIIMSPTDLKEKKGFFAKPRQAA